MRTKLPLLIAPLFLAGCLSHPPPPPAPFHGVGKDSAWTLIIDDKHITFIRAGQQPIREPTPQVIGGIAGEIYQTPRIHVNIVHGTCAIGDRSYADRVQVTVDGVQHEGCGGDPANVAPDSEVRLEGTSWRVVAVNDRQTPAQGDFSMRFDADGRIGARFGCNHMGGSYRLTGSALTVGDMASTLMGCPEPVQTFENQGGAILARPLRVETAAGGRIVLSNEVGSITLAPTG